MENNYPTVVPSVSLDQLPKVISNTYSDISIIDKKIKSAVNKAEEAKNLADDASKKSAGWTLSGRDKKEAIEALQKSNVSLANALSENVEANEQLFQNQQKMAKGLSYLFGLGVMNISANRTVVRELEMKLRHASKEELSELARQEIQNVILQLRAQEDMQCKINKIEENIREINNQITIFKSEIDSFRSTCNSTFENIRNLEDNIQTRMDQFDNDFLRLKSETNKSVEQNLNYLQAKLHDSIKEKEQLLDLKMLHFSECQDKKISKLEKFQEEELSRRSFFTSKVYIILISLISFIALVMTFFR